MAPMKIAVVTGANRGLGLAFCEFLAESGYEVHALCRQTSAALNACASSIYEGIDLVGTDMQLAQRLKTSSIDLLINNAGVGLDDSIEEINSKEIERHFLVNALGAFNVTLALLNKMNEGSKIAFISSRLGSIATNTTGADYAYRMSKAALNAMAKNLSIDLKPRAISVAILSPGKVDTDMLRLLGINIGAKPSEVARRLMAIVDQLNLENSGTFWHVNGDVLPW